MNVERLLAVKQVILDHPENVNMGTYVRGGLSGLRNFKCGTTGCIAGWGVALFSKIENLPDQIPNFFNKGVEIFGLSELQAGYLFAPWWGRAAGARLQSLWYWKSSKEYAQAIADHIDAFMLKYGAVIPEPAQKKVVEECILSS